jgi:hypothetical protein
VAKTYRECSGDTRFSVAHEHFGGNKMRVGLIARTQRGLLGLVLAIAAGTTVPTITHGQSPRPTYGQGTPAASGRPMQALYMAPGGAGGRQSSYTDAYGNPIIVPAGFGQHGGGYGCGSECDCYGGGYGGHCGGCEGCYGPNGCMPMGAGGTVPPIGYDLMNDVGMEGDFHDQRGPHYFDIRMEAVYFDRDKTFNEDIDFTSLNVGNTIVLSSGDLSFDAEPGFRVIGRYDICPLAVLEFGYTGVFGWEDSASVEDPTNNLFSLWSRTAPDTGLFGVSPAGVNLPGGPNPESERASRHAISAESDLQTAEISYRRYWLGYIPRISGTLLAGFRYTKLDDDFTFETQGSEPATQFPFGPLAALEYEEECENNLAGFQAGGDIWISLWQGVRLGTETKFGIYNNHYVLTNEITTTPFNTTPPTLFERIRDDKAAFLTEASIDLVADILPSVSLRVGYEVLYMNSLVLAGENFNQVSPYGNQGQREPFVNDDGEMFYHGGHAGIEYIW